MNDVQRYVPILLTRRGERRALRDLPGSARSAITPLFVVEPIAWDYDTDSPAKSVDEHLATKASDLVECWGVDSAYVDLSLVDDSPMATGEHPLYWLTDRARDEGLYLLPSVGSTNTPDYQAAARDVAARDGQGACLRLDVNNWPTSSSAALTGVLATLRLSPPEVDLVLDLGDEIAAAPALSVTATLNEIAVLPHLSEWRSLTVAGASMPKTLSQTVGRGVNVLARHEWTLHEQLVHAPAKRLPRLGDYAIAHPDPEQGIDPRLMSISAALRYTLRDSWLVSRGDLFKGTGGRGIGGAAVGPVAQALVAHPAFMPNHCDTDDWIVAAAGGGDPGNAETWRYRGTHHHLIVTVQELASLHGASGGPAPGPGVP